MFFMDKNNVKWVVEDSFNPSSYVEIKKYLFDLHYASGHSATLYIVLVPISSEVFELLNNV